MSTEITPQTLLQITDQQISAEFLDGETVILNLKDGVYYGLNIVGTRIWDLLQEPRTPPQIQEALLEEFDVDPDRCQQELMELLRDLIDHGLIQITAESPA